MYSSAVCLLLLFFSHSVPGIKTYYYALVSYLVLYHTTFSPYISIDCSTTARPAVYNNGLHNYWYLAAPAYFVDSYEVHTKYDVYARKASGNNKYSYTRIILVTIRTYRQTSFFIGLHNIEAGAELLQVSIAVLQ